MKFSEFVKNPPPSSQVIERESLRPASPPPPPAPPPRDIEKEIREKLEAEFRLKMQQMELESKKLAEARLQEESRQFMEREKNFQKEIQKLLQHIEDLRKQNESAAEMKHQRQIAEENSAAALQRMVEEFQKRMEEKEKRAAEKERLLDQEIAKRLEQEKSKIEKDMRESVSETAKKAAEELQSKIKETDDLLEVKQSAPYSPPKPIAPPEPPPLMTPTPIHISGLQSASRPLDANQNPITLLDPEQEAKIRSLYQELHRATVQAFDAIASGKNPEIKGVSDALAAILDYMIPNDAEMIWVALEPYPEMDYFVYHAANCALLSLNIGMDLNLTRDQLLQLGLAAIFHDIGLLNIRENLDYPKQLSPEMQQEVMRHPDKGAEMLASFVDADVLSGIRQHHETVSGKGYPHGLEGKDIHLFAKIIQCTDAFEAMTHYRAYRKAPLDVSSAMKEMVETGRGVYDRDVFKALMSRVGLYPVMAMVELSNKQIARVIKQNRKFPLSPIVRVEFDESGAKLKNPPILDLTKNQLIHINGPVQSRPSIAKEKIEMGRRIHSKGEKVAFPYQEIIPFLVVMALLGLLVYLVLKI